MTCTRIAHGHSHPMHKNISTFKKRTLAAALVLLTFTATACLSSRSWPEFEACARSYGYESSGSIRLLRGWVEDYRATGDAGSAMSDMIVACEKAMPR